MKTHIIFSILITLSISFSANAQLKVKSNGDIQIGSALGLPSGGDLEIIEEDQTTEVRIFAASKNISRLWTMNSVYSYGFGIGDDIQGYGHIYKNINDQSPIMTFTQYGNVGVGRTPSYKLDVNGNLRVNYTIYTSDKRLKINILKLSGQSNRLYHLESVSYNNIPKDPESTEHKQSKETMNSDKLLGEPRILDNERIHYGFIAQEVQEVFPELVYEDDDGFLGIDYVAFIPLLVEELKKQQKEIQVLTSDLETFKTIPNYLNNTIGDDALGTLHQNFPNPFNENTIIKFELSARVAHASINIYNLNGNQIQSILIFKRGSAEVNIEGSDLDPGMYLYSLIADGALVDTKTMILTDN